MANPKHLAILEKGVVEWNSWRRKYPRTRPDLSGADLRQIPLTGFDERGDNLRYWAARLGRTNLQNANLSGMNLRGVDFRKANLRRANLRESVLIQNPFLRGSDLSGALMIRANLRRADLSGATLVETNLGRADLSEANLTGADMTKANLKRAIMVETNLTRANLSGCFIYGVSAWDLKLRGATQANLVVTPPETAEIQTDHLEVAQFIFLLLNNQKIRDVIDTVGRRAVLILGRFTPRRKVVLEAVRKELRAHGYLPILFDFDKPHNRDLTETISALAHISRFVIADITDAKSIPQELERIVPNLPSVPVQPLLLKSQAEYGMFEHFRSYPWVLKPFPYKDRRSLLAGFKRKVIAPAETCAKTQTGR